MYLKPSSTTPVYMASTGGAGAKLNMVGEFEERQVEIHDGRDYIERGHQFALDREGFVLLAHTTTVSDFYDQDQISSIYEAELEQLLIQATGAGRVVVFDHTLRSDDPSIREARNTREPAAVVHNDYTDRSARKRLREIMPAAAESAPASFAIVNVWRPIVHPAVTTPLTVCDGRSLDSADLVPVERRARDRTGELMLVNYNPGQRWFYFPHMRPDEVILIKTFDSVSDGRTGFGIHTAFEDPSAPSDAPPRQSIESRAFVFY